MSFFRSPTDNFLDRVARTLFIVKTSAEPEIAFRDRTSLDGASPNLSPDVEDPFLVDWHGKIAQTLKRWAQFTRDGSSSHFQVQADWERFLENETRLWASYRGQTLARTVRGIMYQDRAIALTSALEMCDREGLIGHASKTRAFTNHSGGSLSAISSATDPPSDWSPERPDPTTVRSKFNYVVTCQIFGQMAKSKKAEDRNKARDIERLLQLNPNLRVAYIDTNDEGRFFSVLIRYEAKHGGIEEEFRIELPGDPVGKKGTVGEKKPNNQNHAVVFVRGLAVQAVDMNQDCTLEDALKMAALQVCCLSLALTGRP